MERKIYKHSPIALLVCPGGGLVVILALVSSLLNISETILWLLLMVWFIYRTIYSIKLYTDEIITLNESYIEYHECRLFSSPRVHYYEFNKINNMDVKERGGIRNPDDLAYIVITDDSEHKINLWGYPEKNQMYQEIKNAFRQYKDK